MSKQDAIVDFMAIPALFRIPTDLLSAVLDYARAKCTAAEIFDGKLHDGPLTCHSNICRRHRWCSGACIPGGNGFHSCDYCGNLLCPVCQPVVANCIACKEPLHICTHEHSDSIVGPALQGLVHIMCCDPVLMASLGIGCSVYVKHKALPT